MTDQYLGSKDRFIELRDITFHHQSSPVFDLLKPLSLALKSVSAVGSFVNLEPAFEPQWLSALPGHGASITFIDPGYERLKRLLGSKRDRKL